MGLGIRKSGLKRHLLSAFELVPSYLKKMLMVIPDGTVCGLNEILAIK